MLKSVLPWQLQSRRQTAVSSTGLILIMLVLFYYLSWNTLQSSLRFSQIDYTSTCPAPPEPEICPELTCPAPPSPYDPTKVAFLVETRPLPHLPALFAHMVAVIPPEWTFKFMGSDLAINHMRASPHIRRLEAVGKLEIQPLSSNYSLASRETISRMFTDPWLYTHHLAPAEHLLIFQPDSIFCANAPSTLNDYLEYDWIGAPWSKTATWGGNGGLSLRKVSQILKALAKEKRRQNDGELEDLWLSRRLQNLPGSQMANANVSKGFSVESVWDEAPLGYHVGWLGVHHEQIWDDEAQVDHILEYCPEVKMILGMKLAGDKPDSVAKIDGSKKVETKPTQAVLPAVKPESKEEVKAKPVQVAVPVAKPEVKEEETTKVAPVPKSGKAVTATEKKLKAEEEESNDEQIQSGGVK